MEEGKLKEVLKAFKTAEREILEECVQQMKEKGILY
jgi:hypothetical protein